MAVRGREKQLVILLQRAQTSKHAERNRALKLVQIFRARQKRKNMPRLGPETLHRINERTHVSYHELVNSNFMTLQV